MKKGGHNLPEELVEEILLRLPVKSILRFKSVCKSWSSLINEPRFVNNHLQKTKSNINNNRRLVFGWTRQELSLEEIFDDQFLDDQDLPKKQELSLMTVSGNFSNNIVERVKLPLLPKVVICDDFEGVLRPLDALHCNGIVCLIDESSVVFDRIAFYNIAMGQCKFLNTSSCRPLFEFPNVSYGFGYDPKSDDYKFVRIMDEIFPSPDKCLSKAEVYRVRNESCSELIVSGLGEYEFTIKSKSIYLNGFCYWLNYASILRLDMSREIFHVLPAPSEVGQSWGAFTKLFVWSNESIALLFSPKSTWFSTFFDVFVMTTVDQGGWTKLLSVGPLERIHYPIAFWKEDELLMEGRDGTVFSYNIYNGWLRRFDIPGAILPGSTYAYVYVESLVSVNK